MQTRETVSGNSGHLMKAREVSVLINLYDIFRKNYSIERIILKDAFLNILVFSDGTNNYNVINKPENKVQSENVKLDLRNVQLRNVQISYLNYRTEQEYLFRVNDGRLKGEFESDSYTLLARGDIYAELLKAGKAVLIKERDISTSFSISVDKQNKTYDIKNCKLSVSGIHFLIAGKLESQANKLLTDLKIESQKSSLASFLELVPQEFLKPIKDYSIEGNLLFWSDIRGELSGKNLPLVAFNFELENGVLVDKRSGLTLNDVQFKGTFQNGNLRTRQSYKLLIEGLTARLRSGLITGKLNVENFEHPWVSVAFSTEIDLDEFKDLIKADTLQSISGIMGVDMQFKNSLKGFDRFTVTDFLSSKTSGTMVLKDVNLALKRSPLKYQDLNGSFRFSNKDLIIDVLEGSVANSDFKLKGEFVNILPFLFLPDEKIEVRADFSSTHLHLEDILMHRALESDTLYRLRFSPLLNFDLNLAIEQLSFRKFGAEEIKGKLRLNNKKVYVEEASLKAMDGTAEFDGIIDGTNTGHFQLSCNADFKAVNIQKLFAEFGNFNQESITSEHLRGKVDANVYYSSALSPDLRIDASSVYTIATLDISNGELIQYTPLYKLSRFIKQEELEHIYFSRLKNRIRIRDRVVYIPEMDVESNTLNLKLNGQHSFDNMIEYHVQLKLSELLKKDKKKVEEIDGIFEKEDPSAGSALFLKMTGNAADPDIKYDVKAVQNKLSSDFKNEGKELKEAFQKEFKRRDPDEKETYLEEKEGQQDFIIKWEEEQPDSIIEVKQSEKKKPSKKKNEKEDFIIIWDEENDTIKSF
ncbi:MAG: AsmA-like C-terminal region-containing protein [Bacteroidales bacterium]